MHLLDINVWVALAFLAHHHHVPAKRWFDGLPDSSRCYFCRFTQQGFLRLANNPAVLFVVTVGIDQRYLPRFVNRLGIVGIDPLSWCAFFLGCFAMSLLVHFRESIHP